MRGSGGESHSQNVKFIGGRENEVGSFLKSKDEFFFGGGGSFKIFSAFSNELPPLHIK